MPRKRAPSTRGLALGLALAIGAFGCWFDVPDLRGGGGAGAAAGSTSSSAAGGGSNPACGGHTPVASVVTAPAGAFKLVAVDDGSVVFGAFEDELDCGGSKLPKPTLPASFTSFIAHLDETGACTWAVEVKCLDAPQQYVDLGMAVDPSGSILATAYVPGNYRVDGVDAPSGVGSFVLKLDAHGSSKSGHGWLKFLDGGGAQVETNGASATPDGGALVNGIVATAPWDSGAGVVPPGNLVMRVGPSGSVVWAKTFASADGDAYLLHVVADGAGRSVTFAHVQTLPVMDFNGADAPGPGGVFAAMLDAGGNQLWANTFGKDTTITIGSAAFDAAGDLLVAGTFDTEFVAGKVNLKPVQPENVFVAKLDGANGAVKWAKNIGGTATGETFNLGIAFDAKGQHAWVASTQFEALNFGCGVVEPVGSGDIVLAELTPDGDPLSVTGFGTMAAESNYGIARSPGGALRFLGVTTAKELRLGSVTLKSAPGANETFFVATLGSP